ncbi:hypothetical protein DSO57_1021783 [Entomophthora muscae]|uniref:Uncharacterized protein n=1 Tax=Entomophthora muscae TaxID=34485 RepID=A0ACC2SG07_9FUNG|nr:hypothetical protein DSO57_1021783 [Entomophthora muscae]
MTEQDPPIFAHILNQATSQDTWKTYFHTHDIDDVVNAAIHHVLISPSIGYFEDKSLSFTFALLNESGSELRNYIVQFPDSA